MADDSQQLPRVNWNEVFAFTHIFKSFRMAIHVSKLALALAAVLLIWLWASILDPVSGWMGTSVPDGEIVQYMSPPTDFEKWQDSTELKRIEDLANLRGDAHAELAGLQGFLVVLRNEGGGGRFFENAFQAKVISQSQSKWPDLPSLKDRQDQAKDKWSKAAGAVRDLVKLQAERIEALIEEAKDAAATSIDKDSTLDSKARREAKDKLAKDARIAERALTLRKLNYRYKIQQLEGSGVFEALKAYEGRCLTNSLQAVRYGNITGGLSRYRALMDRRSEMLPPEPDVSGLPATVSPVPADDVPGLLFWVLMMLNGLCWLIARHWVLAILMLAVALAVWALLGGAIHRIAALHFGREQKISIGQALRFSAGKFLSFYFAPLIPLAIILVIGLFITAGGFLLGSWGGGIAMGILLPLALGAGLLIAFLLVGLGGGGALMYPTIAVESSDSFDAIGRSYSYVYGRPWRAAFYGLVAAFYGVICYMFVRFCAFLALATTHWFVGAGVVGGGQAVSPLADKLDVLWPAPTLDSLMSCAPSEAMSTPESIGAWFIWFWTMLVAATVLAFLLSFCSSAKTVIYFLLRRRIDATDLDDVYPVDEPREDFGPEPAEEPAETPAPAGEEKPAAKPEGQSLAGK
jgi:hypothetical protein